MSHEDGEWWVAGDITPPPSEEHEFTNHFVLIEKVDRKTEDPAQRMNYWREMTWDGRESSKVQYVNVRLVEVRVSYVQPLGWETTDHRIILTEDDTQVMWECRCGQNNGAIGYGQWRTVQEARQEAHRRHDRHLVHEVPNLRCARCGERSHSIEYCERDA